MRWDRHSLPRPERRHGRGDRRIFMRPVEPGAGQQLDGAPVQPRMHAVAVELDLVQPFGAFRRRVDELRQLRPDPLRETGLLGSRLARYRPRHAGRVCGLLRGACASSRWSISPTCLAAWASLKLMPLQCRQVGKWWPLITVTSCGMSACAGSWVIV